MARFLSSLPGALVAKVPSGAAAASHTLSPPGTDPRSSPSASANAAAAQDDARRPPPLDPAVAQVVALSAVVVVGLEGLRDGQVSRGEEELSDRRKSNDEWLASICQALKFDPSALPAPQHLRASDIEPMLPLLAPSDHAKVLHLVLLASIFPPSTTSAPGKPGAGDVVYTATARRRVYALASLLRIAQHKIVKEEERVAGELFDMLKRGAEEAAGGGEGAKGQAAKDEVERVRKEREEGWGGKWGRWAATGAGVVLGSVALGLTGGLAAPAILALLPTLGFLTPATAPILLGTFFGLTGGGLAGRRVRRRWGGVGEFEFVEIGGGDAEDDAAASIPVQYEVRKKKNSGVSTPTEGGAVPLDHQLASLDLKDTGGVPEAPPSTGGVEPADKLTLPPRPPSLTVLIALPGLLTQSPDEGVAAWRSVARAPRAGEIRQLPPPRADGELAAEQAQDADAAFVAAIEPGAFELPEEPDEPAPERVDEREGDEGARLLRDRDLFVARVETEMMFSTGKGINDWVTDKLLQKAGQEVLKRTVFNAYMSAVALPLTVYGWAGTALDNTWMRAVDKAKKAGPLLAEILLSRTQGARPVQLVGHSLGAVTVLHALLALASSEKKGAKDLVDAAVLISLPASPSADAWRAARNAVGRRLVNAYSGRDFVLASVVRLHEVIGNAVELRDGARVGGLSVVEVQGVENVDLSNVLDGHFQINNHLPDILRLVDLDA